MAGEPESRDTMLVENTLLTRQMSQQLPDVLSQLARGNERFQNHEMRISALETRLDERIAQLRTDLMRAIDKSSEMRRDNLEVALSPIKTDLATIHRYVSGARAGIRWIIGILAGALMAAGGLYLARVFGL